MMKTNKTRPRVLFYYPMLTYSVAPPNSLHFHCFFGKPKKNEKWKRERLHERNCACLKHSNLFKVIESLNETIHVVKPHLFCFLFSFSFHFFKPPPWEEGERERKRKERKKERKKENKCFLFSVCIERGGTHEKENEKRGMNSKSFNFLPHFPFNPLCLPPFRRMMIKKGGKERVPEIQLRAF